MMLNRLAITLQMIDPLVLAIAGVIAFEVVLTVALFLL